MSTSTSSSQGPVTSDIQTCSNQRTHRFMLFITALLRTHHILTAVRPVTDTRETRTRNSHQKLAWNRTRSICEKYFAASRYESRTSFSCEFTRTSFSYVWHGLKTWQLGAICDYISTQPCIPTGSLNRVPALAGVKAGGRWDSILPIVMSWFPQTATSTLLYYYM